MKRLIIAACLAAFLAGALSGQARAEQVGLAPAQANALYLNASGGDTATGYIGVGNPNSGFVMADPLGVEWLLQPKADGTARWTRKADMPGLAGPLVSGTGFYALTSPVASAFTRNTTRTCTSPATGLITTAATGYSAFESAGISLEEANTNLLLWSDQLDHAGWNGSATVTADQAAAPDGTSTADLVNNGGASGNGRYQSYTVNPNGSTYTFSIWLRAVSGSHAAKMTVENNGATEAATLTPSLTTAWQRFQVTRTFTADSTLLRVRYFPSNSGTETIYAWGAQLSAQQGALSYIPTSSSPVTKALDALSVPNAGALADAAGSIMLSYTPVSASTVTTTSTIVAGPGSGLLYRDGANIKSDDGTSVATVAGTWAAGETLRITLTWDGTGRKLYIGTGTTGTGTYDSSFGIGASIDFFQGASAPNGSLKDVKFWTRKLSDSEVTAWQ